LTLNVPVPAVPVLPFNCLDKDKERIRQIQQQKEESEGTVHNLKDFDFVNLKKMDS